MKDSHQIYNSTLEGVPHLLSLNVPQIPANVLLVSNKIASIKQRMPDEQPQRCPFAGFTLFVQDLVLLRMGMTDKQTKHAAK